MYSAHRLRAALAFVPCSIALDWASFIHPLGPFNITPWNPQAALAIVWMFLDGLRHVPVVLLAIFLADLLVRGLAAGLAISILTSTTLALGYAAIAWLLRSTARVSPNLATTLDLTKLLTVVVAGTAATGLVFVGELELSHALPPASFAEAWLRFWTGDAVGVLVTAPLLLIAADPERRQALKAIATRPETLVQVAMLLAILWLIFHDLGEPSEYFYFLFLPLIWISARGGLVGAIFAIAIAQIGVVIGVYDEGASTQSMLHLQALMAALTLTGLLLGIMVDERQRATESVRETLRLAAAGEMAGAITHEINQPLTALSNYGRSAQILLERGGDTAEVSSILQKMLAESERAAEVVKRLRDFFRAGTTRLEPVPVAALLDAARGMARKLIGTAPIDFDVRSEPDLPPLLVDRLQIEVVLRNLLANSVDSLAAHGERGRISLSAQRHGREQIRIVVIDNGTGVPDTQRHRLFEPFVSGKSTGMGLGLAISRAIARAHGGELESRTAPHGEFHLLLPHAGQHDD